MSGLTCNAQHKHSTRALWHVKHSSKAHFSCTAKARSLQVCNAAGTTIPVLNSTPLPHPDCIIPVPSSSRNRHETPHFRLLTTQSKSHEHNQLQKRLCNETLPAQPAVHCSQHVHACLQSSPTYLHDAPCLIHLETLHDKLIGKAVDVPRPASNLVHTQRCVVEVVPVHQHPAQHKT